MSNETDSPHENAASQPVSGSEAANQNAPHTPEQVMQAATARIAELEAELAEMKERWMRAEAENANVRARARREADDARQYAVQKFATDVVESAENLKRGIDALPSRTPGQPEILAKVREGLESMERNFLGVLERNGIKREDPLGQVFDPNLHQAMAEQESETHKPGTVMQAWTPAWTLHGRLLRPAMVVVAKAPTAEISAGGAPLNATS